MITISCYMILFGILNLKKISHNLKMLLKQDYGIRIKNQNKQSNIHTDSYILQGDHQVAGQL